MELVPASNPYRPALGREGAPQRNALTKRRAKMQRDGQSACLIGDFFGQIGSGQNQRSKPAHHLQP